MKKNDLLLIIFLIVLSSLFFLFRSSTKKEGDTVKIYFDNEEFESVPLSEEREISVNGTNTVCIENGKVFMKSADCPDKICVKQAPLNSSGRDIVCLPNRVTIRVISEKENEVDAVVN